MLKEILYIRNLNVNYSFNNQKIRILKNINFKLFKNEILGIVGESGSGKTTLARALIGVLDKEEMDVSFDQYSINNIKAKTSFSDLKELKGHFINMVMQNPVSSLNPTMIIGDHFRIVLKDVLRVRIKEDQNRLINRALEMVMLNNCNDILKKYPMELSVGMSQRINIALSFVSNPRILILDEPTSSLDEINKEKILSIINNFSKDSNMSTIFITHDILSAIKICHRVLVMKDGRIIDNFYNSAQKRFDNEYTKELYKNSSLNKKTNIRNTNGDLLIDINNVCKSFLNNRVLVNFNMHLKKGEVLGLIGPSGAGKTTISKLILGIYKPSSGFIKIKKSLRIEMIFQNASLSLNHNQKIFKILNENNYINKKKEYSKNTLFSFLKDFNLPKDILEKYVVELSEGQKQIISIIRGLLSSPDVIIFDEPTSSLDVVSQKKMLDLLIRIKKKYNLTYIFISHNQRVVRYICDRCVFLESKRRDYY